MTTPTSAAIAAQRYNSSPAAMAARMQMFYTYVIESPLIAQAASATSNLQMQADYEFMVYSLAVTIVDNAGVVVLPANSTASLQINDTGPGANWFSAPVGLSSVAGSAGLPGILPVVRLVAKTATLSFTFNNVKDGSTVAGVTYTLALIGAKLKNTGSPLTVGNYPPYPGVMG